MIRLHPRYVEGFMPAVAAMLGIGVAWAASRTRAAAPGVRWSATLASPSTTPSACCTGEPLVWWIALAGALGAIALAAARASARRRRCGCARAAAPAGVIALTLVAVLAIPVSADVDGDRRPRQRRRLRRRAARRRAASAQRLPARPPGRRALRGGGRVGDADRLADRQGRAPDRGPHDLQRARVHERRKARSG